MEANDRHADSRDKARNRARYGHKVDGRSFVVAYASAIAKRAEGIKRKEAKEARELKTA